MGNENKKIRQPVAVRFFSQDYYAEEPQRQIEYEILFVESGNGVLYFGHSVSMIQSGDFIFINSFEDHFFRQDNVGGPFRCYRILVNSAVLGGADDAGRLFFESIRLCRFLQMPAELVQKFHKVESLGKNADGWDLILRSLLMDVISYAVETGQYERYSQLSAIEKRSISAIDNALHYIRENYSENLSLKSILALTNYSKSHFIRLFRESTGMNVSEYINKYRIEKACLDLIYTSNNITEIATANGFNNIQYFSRKFREYMKCTPKQYQKKRKKLTER